MAQQRPGNRCAPRQGCSRLLALRRPCSLSDTSPAAACVLSSPCLQIAEPSIARSSVVNADGSISDDPSECSKFHAPHV